MNNKVIIFFLLIIITTIAIGGGVLYWYKYIEVNTLIGQQLELKNNIKQCQENLKSKGEELLETNNILKAEKAIEQSRVTNSQSTEYFTYSDFGNNFKVIKEDFFALDVFKAEELYADSCVKNDLEYYQKILSAYNKEDKGVIYHIEYGGPSQQDSSFSITVIPNKSYIDEHVFMDDFSVCAAGYPRYPHALSEKYLLFVQSCGSGFDDGSGLPIGCDVVKELIEATIKLK